MKDSSSNLRNPKEITSAAIDAVERKKYVYGSLYSVHEADVVIKLAGHQNPNYKKRRYALFSVMPSLILIQYRKFYWDKWCWFLVDNCLYLFSSVVLASPITSFHNLIALTLKSWKRQQKIKL